MSALEAATVANLSTAVEQALSHPAPGSDPADIKHSAAQLASTAHVLRAALASVRNLSHEKSFWVGAAASAFAKQVAHAPKHIDAVADRYDGYARQLRHYAHEVEAIRAELRVRRSDLRRAWAAYQGYAAGRFTPAPPAPAAVPRRDLCGLVNPANCNPHLDDVLRHHRRVCASFDDWEAQARAAAKSLHSVDAHNALQNPQGLHAFVDSVSSYAGDISTLAAAAGLIALVVCPVLAPVLFAVATTSAGVQTAADIDRKVQYGEDVSPFDFADDTLGLVPASGLLKAARAGARATGETAMHSSPYVVGAIRFATHLGTELKGAYAGTRTSAQAIRSGALGDGTSYFSPTLARTSAALYGQGENVVTTALGLPSAVHVTQEQFGTEKAAGVAKTESSRLFAAGSALWAPRRRSADLSGVEVMLPMSTGGVRKLRVVVTTPGCR